MGRFLSTDPLGYADGMNLYAYVRNNPINRVDPLGLFGSDPQGCQCEGLLPSDESGGVITPELIDQLHGLAKDANAAASVIVGGGVPVAGFVGVTVDADGDVSLDLGVGVGAGELSVISVTGQGEVRGGNIGPVRLDFMAGGAIVGGAMQRSSVSLTSYGAATGGGLLLGQGGFVFMGPTVSIPLGNVSDMGRQQGEVTR